MLNKLTNNIPGFGYSGKFPKQFNSFTGLFGASPYFATATYGITEVPIPTILCPYKINLQVKKIKIEDSRLLIYHNDNIQIYNTNSNKVVQNIIKDFPLEVSFYLNGTYSQRWNYQGNLEAIENPLVINNITKIGGNGIGKFPNSSNYSQVDPLSLVICLTKRMS